MILLKYVYNMRRIAWKERRRCEDIMHGEKITMMQQHSTEQRLTVDSRRRPTNFKML